MSIDRFQFTKDGLTFHGLASGAGAPLVLLHGGGSRASHFAPIIPALAERFRVYAYDQRGFGSTGCLHGDPITHQAWADDLIACLDQLGEDQALVCGWSLGATVALNAAAARPERILALALLGAPHPDRPIDRAFFQRRLEALRSGAEADAIIDSVMPHVEAMLSPAADKEAVLPVLRAEQRASFACAEPVTRAYETRPAMAPILRRVSCPTTLIVGEDDRTCDQAGAMALQAQLQLCTLTTIPQCGHYYALEQPARVAEALIAAFS